MRVRHLAAVVLAALALTALAAVSAPGRPGLPVRPADEAVAVAGRSQPALVPAAQRPAEQLALLAVLVSLIGLAAVGRRLPPHGDGGRVLRSPAGPAAYPRGPPAFLS